MAGEADLSSAAGALGDALGGAPAAALAVDALGRAYAWDGGSRLACAGLRSGGAAADGAADRVGVARIELAAPVRGAGPRPLAASEGDAARARARARLACSGSGRALALVGLDAQAGRAFVAVADATALAVRASAAATEAAGIDAGASAAPTREVGARAFAAAPSLRVRAARWHPLSESTLCVLTSDDVLRVYDVSVDAANPQTEIRLSGGDAGASVADFGFGRQVGWERFAVFGLLADGGVVTACPVCPAGAFAPRAAMRALARGAAEGSAARAWLDEAFPALGAGGADDEDGNAVVVRASSAVGSWPAPVVQGPLAVDPLWGDGSEAAQGPAAALSQAPSSRACAIASCGAGGELCCVVAALDSGGALRVFVLDEGLGPRWEGCAADAPRLLLVDRVELDVGDASAALDDFEIGGAGGVPPALAVDNVSVEQLFVSSAVGVMAVALTWLPQVEAVLAGVPDDGKRQSALSMPAVVPMLTVGGVEGGAGLPPPFAPLSAACGARGVLCAAGDEMRLLRAQPPPGAIEAVTPTKALGSLTASPARTPAGSATQGSLSTATPPPLHMPPSPAAAAAASSGAGQEALLAASRSLHDHHVAYAHEASAEMHERLRALGGTLPAAEDTADELEALVSSCEDAADELDVRADRAADFQDNLEARARVVARLLAAAPRPLTAAERRWDTEVQRMEGDVGALAHKLRLVKERVAKLSGGGGMAGGGAGGSGALRKTDALARSMRPLGSGRSTLMPTSQLRKVHDAVAEQTETIKQLIGRLQAMDDGLMGVGDAGVGAWALPGGAPPSTPAPQHGAIGDAPLTVD